MNSSSRRTFVQSAAALGLLGATGMRAFAAGPIKPGAKAALIVEQMAEMILELKSRGVSILLSEQNTHFAELVSDRAYVLEKGQIRYHATMAELAANDEVRRAYLSV